MECMFRAVAVIIGAIGLHILSAAVAQAPKQLELTETHIQGFIASQKDWQQQPRKCRGLHPTSPILRSRQNSKASPGSTGSKIFRNTLMPPPTFL